MTTSPVTSVTDELIAELEVLAGKATGGDWEYHMGLIRTMADSDGYVPVAIAPNCPSNWRKQRDRNMQYIAAAMPEVVLRLLAERAELKRDAGRLEFVVNQGDNCQWMNIIRVDPDDFDSVRAAIDAAMQNNRN